jgi:hypothetical protein
MASMLEVVVDCANTVLEDRVEVNSCSRGDVRVDGNNSQWEHGLFDTSAKSNDILKRRTRL